MSKNETPMNDEQLIDLYHQAAEHEVPSVQQDEIILQAAAAELSHSTKKNKNSPSWFWQNSVAASLLVGVTLSAWLWQQEEVEQLTTEATDLSLAADPSSQAQAVMQKSKQNETIHALTTINESESQAEQFNFELEADAADEQLGKSQTDFRQKKHDRQLTKQPPKKEQQTEQLLGNRQSKALDRADLISEQKVISVNEVAESESKATYLDQEQSEELSAAVIAQQPEVSEEVLSDELAAKSKAKPAEQEFSAADKEADSSATVERLYVSESRDKQDLADKQVQDRSSIEQQQQALLEQLQKLVQAEQWQQAEALLKTMLKDHPQIKVKQELKQAIKTKTALSPIEPESKQ